MAELHSNFYFKHPNKAVHDQLQEMLAIYDMNSKNGMLDVDERRSHFLNLAKSINPENGEMLASDLLGEFDKEYGFGGMFGSESIREQSGYCITHWVNGGSGDDIQAYLMQFFYKLCPEVHAQSWGCGDDDPWEYWFKYDNGNLVRHDDEPYSSNDAVILGTIYRWWHSDMPDSIKEGVINDEYYQEICEEDYNIKASTTDAHAQVSDEIYNKWLSDSVGLSKGDGLIGDPPSKDSSVRHFKYETDHAELVHKIKNISVVKLVIFTLSLSYLLWVFFVK